MPPSSRRSARSPSPLPSTTTHTTTTSSSSSNGAATHLIGVTLDERVRFSVPDTPTTVEALMHFYSLPSMTTILLFAVSMYAALPQHHPKYIVFLCIFWRLAYDVGLGLMLHLQSKTQFMTKLVATLQRWGPQSYIHQAISSIIDTTMGVGHNSLEDESLPPEYSAWILTRFVVNIILPNDVMAFCLAAARFTDWNRFFWFFGLVTLPPEEIATCDWNTRICVSPWILYPFGVVLMVTSLMAKVSAHHVIGQFAWFWGDFFFRIDQSLTFDGIFELLPHPMYTLGYGWAYAVAMFSGDYTVLALALGSHFAQMCFLQFVETPHIEKLYGSSSSQVEPSPTSAKPANVFIIKNFDAYRASDISLVMTVVFLIVGVLLGSYNNGPLDSDTFFIAHAIFWRAVASLSLAYVLIRQEKDRFWTKHWVAMGSSEEEAFENWKRLMNLLMSLQHVSFLLAAWRLYYLPDMSVLYSSQYVGRVIFAFMLWGVTHWSFSSSFTSLGDFGWFYGDFFLKPPPHAKLTYTGIYRYINNPDVYLGHVWLYACALLCSSWELFFLGFLAQASHVVFLQLVEKPHLRAIYATKVRPFSTAFEAVLKKKVREVATKTQQKVQELGEKKIKEVVAGLLPRSSLEDDYYGDEQDGDDDEDE